MSSLWATGRVAPALMGALCILLPACGPPGQGEETSAQQPQVRLQAPPASPGDTDPRAEKALGKIVEGKFTGARAILAAVLADHPGSFRCRFLEAFSWQRQKRYEKARQGFEEVLRSRAVFPGSENVLHFHGWAHYHLGRLREAEAHLVGADLEEPLAEGQRSVGLQGHPVEEGPVLAPQVSDPQPLGLELDEDFLRQYSVS